MLITCICAVSHFSAAKTPESGKATPESGKATPEPGKATSEPGKPTPKPGKQKEFISVQRLVPRLYNGPDWTKEDKAAEQLHFVQFMEKAKSGQLILAGRTKEPGDKTFGIAIFRAADEAAAREFMESDPAVVAKIMTAELHPFNVHIQRKAP